MKFCTSVKVCAWFTLKCFEIATFRSKYSGKSCLSIYNAERNKVLLPVLYYDRHLNPWLTYYFVSIREEDTLLYKWNKFPTQEVNHAGKESLQVVYNLRTIISNWNWGAVNKISTESFWINNFKEQDLELVVE